MLCHSNVRNTTKVEEKVTHYGKTKKIRVHYTIYSVTRNSRIPKLCASNFNKRKSADQKASEDFKIPFPVQFIYQYSDKIIF